MSENLRVRYPTATPAEQPSPQQEAQLKLQALVREIVLDAGDAAGEYNENIESPEGGE